MLEVYVQTDILEKEEIRALSNKEISVDKLVTMGFIPEEFILVIMECSQNIKWNLVYDSLKYVALSISNKLKEKKIPKTTKTNGKIIVGNGNKSCTIEINYPISEETFKELALEAIRGIYK